MEKGSRKRAENREKKKLKTDSDSIELYLAHISHLPTSRRVKKVLRFVEFFHSHQLMRVFSRPFLFTRLLFLLSFLLLLSLSRRVSFVSLKMLTIASCTLGCCCQCCQRCHCARTRNIYIYYYIYTQRTAIQ